MTESNNQDKRVNWISRISIICLVIGIITVVMFFIIPISEDDILAKIFFGASNYRMFMIILGCGLIGIYYYLKKSLKRGQ